MPFQPQPACVADLNLESYETGVCAFLFVEFIIQFLMRLHSIPLLHNCISSKTKERCQVLASILATVAIVPLLRVALDAPTLLSTSYETIAADPKDIEVIIGAVMDIIINLATAIFIVAYMYFRIQTMAWKYSVERLKYMENPEQYASDEDSQLKKGLPSLPHSAQITRLVHCFTRAR